MFPENTTKAASTTAASATFFSAPFLGGNGNKNRRVLSVSYFYVFATS